MAELTQHFSWAEAARSATAEAKGIDNTIPDALFINVREVAESMEEVRALLGGKPLRINSWYRCRDLNRAIGGSPRSAHMQGFAVDFEAPEGMTNAKAFEKIATSDIVFDQLIHEQTRSGADWIHFALSYGVPRQQVMAAAGDTLGGAMTFRRVALG
jgi:zinc D-Ala-D-Ala carboxypeptidase